VEEFGAASLPAANQASDSLIAGAYLAGTNTRRVRRALSAVFGGAVSKDTVSRVWRKVKGDWDAWNARPLAGEPIIRLILDGTVVRVRLYLNAYASVAEASTEIGAWLGFYNEERQHQSLGYRTPRQIYEESLWICGQTASPTGCASPASRANSESGEMLAFAHIPIGTTTNQGLDLDDSKNRTDAPASVLTALGADLKPRGATP
jgi:hypothetical protein